MPAFWALNKAEGGRRGVLAARTCRLCCFNSFYTAFVHPHLLICPNWPLDWRTPTSHRNHARFNPNWIYWDRRNLTNCLNERMIDSTCGWQTDTENVPSCSFKLGRLVNGLPNPSTSITRKASCAATTQVGALCLLFCLSFWVQSKVLTSTRGSGMALRQIVWKIGMATHLGNHHFFYDGPFGSFRIIWGPTWGLEATRCADCSRTSDFDRWPCPNMDELIMPKWRVNSVDHDDKAVEIRHFRVPRVWTDKPL
jgi:hypothetical protein